MRMNGPEVRGWVAQTVARLDEPTRQMASRRPTHTHLDVRPSSCSCSCSFFFFFGRVSFVSDPRRVPHCVDDDDDDDDDDVADVVPLSQRSPPRRPFYRVFFRFFFSIIGKERTFWRRRRRPDGEKKCKRRTQDGEG